MDLEASVECLDELLDAFATLAHGAADRHWAPAAQAAATLARKLEALAGDLDTAEDPAQVAAALAAVRVALPSAFEAFGRAIGDNLTAGRPRGRPMRAA